MTFTHVFTRKIRCTVTVSDTPPPKGSISQLDYHWTERLKPKHVRECGRWVVEVNRICADRWQTSVLYCIQTTSTAYEVWAFEPGKAPKRVSEKELEGA